MLGARRACLRDASVSLVLSALVCCLALWENWGMAMAEIAKCVGTFAMLGVLLGSLSSLKRFLLGLSTRQRNSSCTS